MIDKILIKTSQTFLLITIFLIPLFFWPFTNEIFIFPKVNLFYLGFLLSLIFLAAGQVAEKKIKIILNPFFYPLLLISFANLVSIIINWQSIEKFSSIWAGLPFLVFPFFLILLSSLGSKNSIKNLFLLAGSLISILGVSLFLLPQEKYPLNFQIFGFPLTIPNSSVSPTGKILTSLVFLISLVSFLVQDFSRLFNEKEESHNLFFFQVIARALVSLMIITGLGVLLFQTTSVAKPLILPSQFGWTIAVENLKNIPQALFGSGPGQFLSSFTRNKPAEFNQTAFWNMRFSGSSNEFFQVLTCLGLGGLAVYLYLISRFLKTQSKSAEFYAAGVILLSLAFFPADFFLYFLLIVYLSLIHQEDSRESHRVISFELTQQASVILSLISLLILLPSFYLLSRNLSSEINFKKSLVVASQGQGIETYNLQIKAISQNPNNSEFHRIYSNTNLALANSLATKENLSDQEKQTITQLVQQAIREARNAVALAPNNVTVWENLASLYHQLFNFAQGADQWAIASLNQTIRLDPNNPQLYLNLGGLYYSLNRFDEAINLFQTSVGLKPDFANGYYNLAAAFREKKDFQKAFEALNQASRFIDVNSPDYQKVQAEIEEVKKMLPQAVEETPFEGEETLSLPEPLPSPQPELTPIELPPAEEEETVETETQ